MGLVDDADDVVFTHVQEVLAFELEFLAGILAEKDLVARLDAHRDDLAVVVGLAGPGVDDFADRRLLGGRVGNDDAAGRLALLFEALDDDPVVQRGQAYLLLRHMIDRAGQTNAAAPSTMTAARQLVTTLLTEERRGYEHAAFADVDLSRWLLAVYATGRDDLLATAHASDYLATGTHSTTFQTVGISTHGSFDEARGTPVDLDGPSFEPLTGWADPQRATGIAALFIVVNSIAGLAGRASSLAMLPDFLPWFALAAIAGAAIGTTVSLRGMSKRTILRALGAVLGIAAAALVT